jgi:hypothetical protein
MYLSDDGELQEQSVPARAGIDHCEVERLLDGVHVQESEIPFTQDHEMTASSEVPLQIDCWAVPRHLESEDAFVRGQELYVEPIGARTVRRHREKLRPVIPGNVEIHTEGNGTSPRREVGESPPHARFQRP